MKRLALALALGLAPPAMAAGQDTAVTTIASAVDPGVLSHRQVIANGVRLHYVVSGQGEPVLLVPGWPESWYAWRNVIPRLVAQGRQVYALDPRGFGDSAQPATGYDLDTAAADVHAFIGATGLARPGGVDVVAHDVGGWIAYAHASAHPDEVRSLVLIESGIPGTAPPSGPPDDASNVKSFHFAFNRLDNLPELLVAGHERAYLTWLFQNKAVRTAAFDQTTMDEYVRAFTIPGAAHSGFAYYRQAFSADGLARTKERLAKKLPMPMLIVGAEGGAGLNVYHAMKSAGASVQGTELMGCGHYLPDECPAALTDAITGFWQGKAR